MGEPPEEPSDLDQKPTILGVWQIKKERRCSVGEVPPQTTLSASQMKWGGVLHKNLEKGTIEL